MKKILLITRPIVPPWDEASKNFAYFLARNLKRHRATLLTSGRLPEDIDQLHIYKGSHLDAKQKLRLLKASRRKKDFDIIHFMLTPTKLNSRLFKRLFRKKGIKSVQTVATLRQDLFSNKELRKMLFADKIVTYSDYAQRKLSTLGVHNARRIYPGIDLGLYRPAPPNKALAKQLGLKPKDFVVIYPGEYTRLGATDDLVKLVPLLAKALPKAKLVFACRVKNQADERKKQAVMSLFREQRLLDRVVFTDTVADMPALYNLADVVIFPVRDMKGKFDVPLAVIEAMACAKPVILSDLTVLSEFARASGSAIIPAGDNQRLLTELTILSEQPKRAQQMAKTGRRYTEKNFDIKHVTELYEKLYDELIV